MKILDKILNRKPKINVIIEIRDCPDKEHLLKHINRITEYFYDKFPDNGQKCGQFTNNHGKVKGITDIKVTYSSVKSKMTVFKST